MTLRKDQNPKGPKSSERPTPQLCQDVTTEVQEPRAMRKAVGYAGKLSSATVYQVWVLIALAYVGA